MQLSALAIVPGEYWIATTLFSKFEAMRSSILTLIAFFLCQDIVNASSFTEPHDHDGIVPPFTPGDPKIPLNNKALAILASGKPYQTQIQSTTGGRGLVVQDVDAPTDVVWGRILDYDNYSKMVPKTIESRNYKVEDVKPTKKDPLSQIIYTRMKVRYAPLLPMTLCFAIFINQPIKKYHNA